MGVGRVSDWGSVGGMSDWGRIAMMGVRGSDVRVISMANGCVSGIAHANIGLADGGIGCVDGL